MPASTKKKPNQEKLLFIRVEILFERCKALLSTANDSLEAYKPDAAAAMFEKISSLSDDLTEAFSSWLLNSSDLEDENIVVAKTTFNEIAKSTDDILVKLRSIAPVNKSAKQEKEQVPSRLRKVDFRPLDKGSPKNWFEDLEIVFKAMGINDEAFRYASLLRLVDGQTSTLLSTISREQPADCYTRARKVIIAEFSLSKFDRAKMYLHDSAPGPDENLSHFASRIE
ncbi:Hypothetical predicted protein, partial [Paramuricea clavata]